MATLNPGTLTMALRSGGGGEGVMEVNIGNGWGEIP